MTVFGMPVIWQVTLPLEGSVVVPTLMPNGRLELVVQVVTSPPVLVKAMAGLTPAPTIAITGAVMLVRAGAVTTVIITVAEDGPAVLVAVMV